MSANNQLIISKNGDGWRIDDVDVETGHGMAVNDFVLTIPEAIEEAQKYMEENEVEYGWEVRKDNSDDYEK